MISTIYMFIVDHMNLNDMAVTLLVNKIIKQYRKGRSLRKVEYRA